jgi:hypothetical protein
MIYFFFQNSDCVFFSKKEKKGVLFHGAINHHLLEKKREI